MYTEPSARLFLVQAYEQHMKVCTINEASVYSNQGMNKKKKESQTASAKSQTL